MRVQSDLCVTSAQWVPKRCTEYQTHALLKLRREEDHILQDCLGECETSPLGLGTKDARHLLGDTKVGTAMSPENVRPFHVKAVTRKKTFFSSS